MQITRITTSKHPDKVRRKLLLNTDDLKNKAKDIYKRIEECNERIDEKFDKLVDRIVNVVG